MKDLLIIPGVEPVYEALISNYPIKYIYVKDDIKHKKYKTISNIANSKNISISTKNIKFFDQYYNKIQHQGIIAFCENNFIVYESVNDFLNKHKNEKCKMIILDGIEDMHNMGAIARTCYFFGISGIIIRKNRSAPINETLIRTSVGAIFNMPIIQVTNITTAIKDLKKNNFWIAGTSSHEGSEISSLREYQKIAVVMGNEKKGVSRLVSDNCDFFIEIKGTGKFESLNVSVSTGIICHYLFEKID